MILFTFHFYELSFIFARARIDNIDAFVPCFFVLVAITNLYIFSYHTAVRLK